MTFAFSANNTPATFAVAMYNLKAQLVSLAAWVVKSSSDGTTYNSTGDQLTGGGSGANGFDNASAWFRIQSPDGNHEFTVQRNSTTGANTSRSVRLKYSKANHFTGGSPGATQTPSATDEQILIGGGTDASPTFTQWMSASDNTYSQNIGADAATPYGFFCIYVVTGSAFTTLGGHLLMEPMSPSTPTTDVDPYVIYFPQNGDTAGTNFALSSIGTGTNNALNTEATAAHVSGYSGSTFVSAIPLYVPVVSNGGVAHSLGYGTGTNWFNAEDQNATSKDLVVPCLFARGSTLSTPGFKGFSSNLKMFLFQVVARSQLTLESIITTGDNFTIGPNGTATNAPFTLPWNNTTING